jgi:hypothetical protein
VLFPPSEIAAEPSPSPAASALPYIGGTRASQLCRTLRESIAPAVLGLMKTDELIDASRNTYRRMAGERAAAAGDLGRVSLGKTVTGMARNLATVRGLIDDPRHFPRSDDGRLQQVRDRLRDVASHQEAALNMINGVLETDLLSQMMGGVPRAPRFGINRKFYHLVGVAIKEQQDSVGASEQKLAPLVVDISASCGAQPSPSPDPSGSPGGT